jgi:hypothetical protein
MATGRPDDHLRFSLVISNQADILLLALVEPVCTSQ